MAEREKENFTFRAFISNNDMIPTDEGDADDEHDEPDPAATSPLRVLCQPFRLDAESFRVPVVIEWTR